MHAARATSLRGLAQPLRGSALNRWDIERSIGDRTPATILFLVFSFAFQAFSCVVCACEVRWAGETTNLLLLE